MRCAHCPSTYESPCVLYVYPDLTTCPVQVVVLQRDAGSLRLGRDVPRGGANVLVLDMFDAGKATAHNWLNVGLDVRRRTVEVPALPYMPTRLRRSPALC